MVVNEDGSHRSLNVVNMFVVCSRNFK